MIRRTVIIVNKLGLHARAASKLTALASRFDCDIQLRNKHRTANAKSIMGVMMLAATQGTELELLVRGDDAETAAEQLAQLIADKFGEAQ